MNSGFSDFERRENVPETFLNPDCSCVPFPEIPFQQAV